MNVLRNEITKRTMNSVTFVLIVLIVIVNLVKAQNACKTAGKEPGKCVPIDTCFVFKDFLTNPPKSIPPRFMSYLQKSYCDFKDDLQYVCCSERHITQSQSSTQPIVVNKADGDGIVIPVENDYEDISRHPSLNLLSQNVCGRIAEDKISNGNETALAEFPWMVLLRYGTSKGLQSRCGGSLISPRYVLTAAHCVTGISDPVVSVRLGEYDTSRDFDCEDYKSNENCMPAVQDIPIEEIIYHPKFNKPRYSNDVAVIRLRRNANINNENVLPICLPTRTEIQNTELDRVTISGWGLTENQVSSTILMKAIIPVQPNEECQRAFKRSARITAAQICAGGEQGVDSCRGDSGGPLFFPANIRGFRYVQFGIISAGLASCGSSTATPGIYARVAFYMKWILDQIKP